MRTKKKKEAGETIDLIPNIDAHPCIDYANKISFFHNGTIANFSELIKEVKDWKDVTPELKAAHRDITDSQLVAFLISHKMSQGSSLKEALKIVVETKLLGTYRIAVMENSNPKAIYFVKNSGDFILAHNKTNDEIIVSSDVNLFKNEMGHSMTQIIIPNN